MTDGQVVKLHELHSLDNWQVWNHWNRWRYGCSWCGLCVVAVDRLVVVDGLDADLFSALWNHCCDFIVPKDGLAEHEESGLLSVGCLPVVRDRCRQYSLELVGPFCHCVSATDATRHSTQREAVNYAHVESERLVNRDGRTDNVNDTPED